MQQLVARGQGADGRQVQLLQLPLIAFVLAQFQLQDFDLRTERETLGIVVEVVIGHAQTVLAKGAVAAGAEASLPGAGFVAILW
ncbi:hypothetical protein D3C85_1352950 [compost metagenome]